MKNSNVQTDKKRSWLFEPQWFPNSLVLMKLAGLERPQPGSLVAHRGDGLSVAGGIEIDDPRAGSTNIFTFSQKIFSACPMGRKASGEDPKGWTNPFFAESPQHLISCCSTVHRIRISLFLGGADLDPELRPGGSPKGCRPRIFFFLCRKMAAEIEDCAGSAERSCRSGSELHPARAWVWRSGDLGWRSGQILFQSRSCDHARPNLPR